MGCLQLIRVRKHSERSGGMISDSLVPVLEKGFPFWDRLSDLERGMLVKNSIVVSFDKETLIHRVDQKCAGVLLILSGQIRAYILSEDGREVTLYRLSQGDNCVLSASCVLDAIAFDILIEAVEDTEVILIPLSYFKQLMEQNVYVELFTYRSSTERFSDVMWTMQQILFMKADQRLAIFLWDEILKRKDNTIYYTHDQIARYMGSAREVVSRTLKYFSEEGIVKLSRGKITVIDKEKLKGYL